jgi:hypothetical protein
VTDEAGSFSSKTGEALVYYMAILATIYTWEYLYRIQDDHHLRSLIGGFSRSNTVDVIN